MVNPSINDAPLLASGMERRGAEGPAPETCVELTPRGLELLEALNDLFDTLAATESGSEPARGTHDV